jgi:hypothetical protein
MFREMPVRTLTTNPKNATEHDHPIPASQVRFMGGDPSRASSSSFKAGIIPTNPAAKGIVPVATAVVCTTMISCALSGRGSSREMRKPIRADCKDILQRYVGYCLGIGSARVHGNPSCLKAKRQVGETEETSYKQADGDSLEGKFLGRVEI